MDNPRSYLFDIDSRFMACFEGLKDFEEEGLLVIADDRPAPTIGSSNVPTAQTMEPEEEIRNTQSTYVSRPGGWLSNSLKPHSQLHNRCCSLRKSGYTSSIRLLNIRNRIQ